MIIYFRIYLLSFKDTIYCIQYAKRKETIAKTMLSGAKVILFGPQARGDAREDSDWDILILLNKDKVELDDHDYISYPFFELG